MTDKVKLFDSEISKCLSCKDFESINKLFVAENFSVTDLLVFYKRKNKPFASRLFSISEFWNSKLPHLHLRAIMESDFKISFLESYFLCDSNCSNELNQHLAIVAKQDFTKFIKLWEVFNKPNFFNSLQNIAKIDAEIEIFVKELDIIKKAQLKIKEQEEADKIILEQFSLGELVISFSLYYYNFKQNPQIFGNKKVQTSIEMTLVNELNAVFDLFKGKNNILFQFESNEELQKEFQRNEAPHHTLGKQGLWIPIEEKYKFLYSIIDRIIERSSWKGKIQLYLSGYVDFENLILNPALLKSNNNYRIFKINDSKSLPEESYFIDLKIEDIYNGKILSNIDITTSLKCLKFYGIPEVIKNNGKEIEIKKVLQLLRCFSVYKGPAERTISDEKSYVIMNQGDKQFVDLFGSNESISLFDFEKLSKGVSEYFKWTDQETEEILDFLTLDLTSSSFPHSWLSKPFLKSGNQVIWLGSFLKDRRWENILLNKLKRDNDFVTVVNSISANFESIIENLFKCNSFKTLLSWPYKSINGQTGDFDVLAYKDNSLIICEAKMGVRSDAFVHAAKTTAIRLEVLATGQLEKAIRNIEENWPELSLELGISEPIEIKDINIIPLIVTDNFEGDLRLYKDGILKTSLLELEVNLKNKKKELLEMYLLMQVSMNPANINYKENNHRFKNWDLWKGENECSVEILIDNIKSNAIWKELETVWKFDDVKFLLHY